ncbi:GntR family transcriptional regulator [Thalassospira marina]|uniref:GntR family transcriptional regulator n=2 Tax=Thalassospira marina TaxID=2048283 RepID=A0A2N3KBW7_9PROT|nr:GntR family transcriptional regulator [Thalassospira marina]
MMLRNGSLVDCNDAGWLGKMYDHTRLTMQEHMGLITGKTAGEIVFSVKKAVQDGTLIHDQPLPPIRMLAAKLGVNRNTVAAAYRTLSEQGLLAGKGRQGSRIHIANQPGQPVQQSRPLQQPLQAHTGSQSVAQPLRMQPSALAAPHYKDLAWGNPDQSMLPEIAGLLGDVPYHAHKYEDAPDNPTLIDLFCQGWLSDDLPIGEVWLASGTFDAIDTILRRFVIPGEKVAIEDPCFMTTRGLVQQAGYTPQPMPVDDEGVTPQGLEDALVAGAKAVILTPRAQNPFGGSWSMERQCDLIAILDNYPDVVVIEDDFFAALSSVTARSAIRSDREKWAMIRSVSKSLGQDLRLAAVNSSIAVHRACASLNAFKNRWVSGFLQSITLSILQSPDYPGFIEKARHVYAQRRETTLQELTRQGIAAHGSDGINVWIPVSDEAQIMRRLFDHGWSVRQGSVFRLQSAPGIRITTAAMLPDHAAEFARTLAYILQHDRIERGA